MQKEKPEHVDQLACPAPEQGAEQQLQKAEKVITHPSLLSPGSD